MNTRNNNSNNNSSNKILALIIGCPGRSERVVAFMQRLRVDGQLHVVDMQIAESNKAAVHMVAVNRAVSNRMIADVSGRAMQPWTTKTEITVNKAQGKDEDGATVWAAVPYTKRQTFWPVHSVAGQKAAVTTAPTNNSNGELPKAIRRALWAARMWFAGEPIDFRCVQQGLKPGRAYKVTVEFEVPMRKWDKALKENTWVTTPRTRCMQHEDLDGLKLKVKEMRMKVKELGGSMPPLKRGSYKLTWVPVVVPKIDDDQQQTTTTTTTTTVTGNVPEGAPVVD
jgi:hypothetical protein